jgi:phenylpropionate dioxygenase-like ring-hydroxylating dioxygenase large terminal subunit
VFQNICRHRGMILCREPKKIEGAIRCPNHSWYSTEGCLVSTRMWVAQVTTRMRRLITFGLTEVRRSIWFDTVLSTSTVTPPRSRTHPAELIARWSNFDQPMYHGGGDSTFVYPSPPTGSSLLRNYCVKAITCLGCIC